MFVIRLRDLRFFARIGVFDQERRVGNEFVVNLTVSVDSSGFKHEMLETSVSYASLFEVVQQEMNKESLLLESVAKSIAESLRTKYDTILGGAVEIIKTTPPIAGIDGNASVEYVF